MSISVLAPGMLTTVQDSGRAGYAALGVGRAGAMDTLALRLANCLVGNVENAAALEMTLRGPRLRFDTDSLIAITGTTIDVHCDNAPVPAWRPVLLRAGSELVFGGMAHGARSYLCIAGGILIAPVLGSRCMDINAGIGPNNGRQLAAGDSLPTQAAPQDVCRELWQTLRTQSLEDRGKKRGFAAANWSLDSQPWLESGQQQPLRVVTGAHFPHLDLNSQRALFDTEFRIQADSNRVGYRLGGRKLELGKSLELVSAGVVPGTLQLPPGGDPIVLMAEAPTCGGYPRIAHVIAVDLARLAQRRPGDPLRFAETSLEHAQTRYLERERVLARIERNIAERLRA